VSPTTSAGGVSDGHGQGPGRSHRARTRVDGEDQVARGGRPVLPGACRDAASGQHDLMVQHEHACRGDGARQAADDNRPPVARVYPLDRVCRPMCRHAARDEQLTGPSDNAGVGDGHGQIGRGREVGAVRRREDARFRMPRSAATDGYVVLPRDAVLPSAPRAAVPAHLVRVARSGPLWRSVRGSTEAVRRP
jgi:hypothetical protein